MDAGVRSSVNPLCAVEGGISFWVLQLTEDQIEQLNREQTQSIRAIEPNTPLDLCDAPISPNLMRREEYSRIPLAKERDRHDKRQDVIIEMSGQDIPELRFISSKRKGGLRSWVRNSRAYVYLFPAGAGTTVYLIDSGVEVLHGDLQHVNIPKWIFALDSDPTYSDDPASHGTCVASLITGNLFGVSKAMDLIPVKIAPFRYSFLDAVGKVVEDVKAKVKAGIEVRGRTVVNISSGFPPRANDASRRDLVNNLNELTRKYEVVVVVAAGNDKGRTVALWPAGLAPSVNIITVGPVKVTDGPDNGQICDDWAVRDPSVTVNAPGEGMCATVNNGVKRDGGTSLAAGRLSGLAGYLLSIDDGARMRRGQTNIPTAMKNRLQKLSFSRSGQDLAVSNGLDGDDYV